ncbi:uncharacterized protein BKA55DRAFT_295178 [Fusarium redolens]|uniref:Uncharacterized protein n=1 Tax=Fusarium redolens TaxID=48865 RepID=A0A9P9KMI4_FUSRE|nr:uncharacterized protein BKA55DRAFT_295178 [Fusarium redolens]KAH7259049.1 hypothetical protein BKA55DRAFT_295178 [Fusarium redolens]
MVFKRLLLSTALSGRIGLTVSCGSSAFSQARPIVGLVRGRSPNSHPHLSPSRSRYQMLRRPRFPILALPIPRILRAIQTRDSHPASLTRGFAGSGIPEPKRTGHSEVASTLNVYYAGKTSI